MIKDRLNRSHHKMTADEARGVLREMEQQVKSATRRKQMAAFFAKNPAGKLSPEAIAVYQQYAAS